MASKNKNTKPEVAKEVQSKDVENKVTEQKVTEGNKGKQVKPVEKTVKPEVEPKTESKKQTITGKNILSAIKDKSFKESLEIGKEVPEVRTLAYAISRFEENLDTLKDATMYVRVVFGIYTELRNALNEKDYNLFNLKYRYFLNVMCKGVKENKISELSLLKYDYKWGQIVGGISITTGDFHRFSKMLTVVFVTCEKGIRNVGKVINMDGLDNLLTNTAIENIKRFYNL